MHDGTPSISVDEVLERWNEDAKSCTSFFMPRTWWCCCKRCTCRWCTGWCANLGGGPEGDQKSPKWPGGRSRRDHFRASENCRDGMVPADWKEAMIISLYKGKGSRTVCSNHRPIALLSVPGKVFAHVLLERLQPLLTRQRGPQQSRFTRSSRQSTPYWHCVFWLNCKLNSENRSRWPT